MSRNDSTYIIYNCIGGIHCFYNEEVMSGMILITEGLIAELLLLAHTDKDMFRQRVSDIFDQYPYIKKQYEKFIKQELLHGGEQNG